MAAASHLSTSLNSGHTQDIEIGLLLQNLLITRNLKSIGYNSNTFGSIKCGVGDLCLERQALHCGHVEIYHFQEISHLFHAVLEINLSIFIYVTEITSQNCLVLTKIEKILVSKL